jgi:hypothetical protein
MYLTAPNKTLIQPGLFVGQTRRGAENTAAETQRPVSDVRLEILQMKYHG